MTVSPDHRAVLPVQRREQCHKSSNAPSCFRCSGGAPVRRTISPRLPSSCNLPAAFFGIAPLVISKRTRMKRTTAIAALGLSLMSSTAIAEERSTDAALGAVSGAVVLGPVGAVAGALVGFTAGPSISRSWRLRRSSAARERRKSARQDVRPTAGGGQPVPGKQPSAPTAASAPPASHSTASTAPPVQTLE